MQRSIGELIRQARRQQNMTQTELGGTRFSKSYVSAVERNKITSSEEALRFFAEQLGLPDDYFTSLLRQVGNGQLAVFNTVGTLNVNDAELRDQAFTLLDALLESTELPDFPTRYELPTLSTEVIAALPPDKQSRYYFLLGLNAQSKQDILKARCAFEYALALAPDQLCPAILNELAVNYYLAKAYSTALGFCQRALSFLRREPESEAIQGLRFRVEMHCGDAYRALGAYQEAYEHYEQARQHLRVEHNMKTAGLLYIGLGYCTYILIQQKTALILPYDQRATFEEMEREFQRAISFLLQCRSVYQVSGDRTGETSARLILAAVLLNFCTRQRQMVQEKAKVIGRQVAANCASLLNDAEEQCRQVLLSWQDATSAMSVSLDLDATIYVALAYLIRIAVQRAVLARVGEYRDTAFRERAIASYLSQRVLDSFLENSLPWTVMRDALALQVDSVEYRPPSLPRLPVLADGKSTFPHNPLSQVEVYFAAGEVAEEFGRTAASYEYAHDCYTRATQFLQAALAVAQRMREDDQSYVLRCYQRFACMLEERMQASPELSEETMKILTDVLKEEVTLLQYPVLPVDRENL